MNKTKRACSLAMSFVLLLTMLGAAQLGVFAAYGSDTPISSFDVTKDTPVTEDGSGDNGQAFGSYGVMSGWAMGAHYGTYAKKNDGLGGYDGYYLNIKSDSTYAGYIDIQPGEITGNIWAQKNYSLSTTEPLVFDLSLYIPEANGAGQIMFQPLYAESADATTGSVNNYAMFGLDKKGQNSQVFKCNSGEWNRITLYVYSGQKFDAYVNGIKALSFDNTATMSNFTYLWTLRIKMANDIYNVNPTGEFCFDDLKIYQNPVGTPDTAPEAAMVSNDITQKVAVVDNTDSEVYISGTTTVESLKAALAGEGYTAVPITESKDGKDAITKVAYWKEGCAVPRYYKVLPGDYFKVVGMAISDPKTTGYNAMKATVKIGLDYSEAPVLFIGEYSTFDRSKLARTTSIPIESKGRVEELFEVANVYMRTAFLFKSLESLQPLCAKLYF